MLSLLQANTPATAVADGVPEWLPGAFMAAGVLYFTLWGLRRLSNRARRSSKRTVGPTAFANATGRQLLAANAHAGAERPTAPHQPDPTTMRRQLEGLMVDVQEVTRLSAAQIENRAAMLDRLVADADHKIAQLEDLLHRVNRAQASLERTDAGSHRPAVEFPRQQSPSNDPLTQRVLQMAERGHSPMHIASSLNEQIGKVNLILALNAPPNSARNVSG
ncbi:MAG: hypothetical protein RLN60_04805 [Phycisphaerales bacterium]